ncbi:MAG: hypothetical protein PHW95_00505 [Patescibacteria group bacterium]|nr:hypothetical protein [Patescibacteria group bacterium]
MTDERWTNILGHIKDNFEVISETTEVIPEEVGTGSIEIIEFNGPAGKIKLERTTQPLVIDKKTLGSKRIGSQATVEYIYSDTEKVHKFTAYKFDEATADWVELKMEKGDTAFF